MPRGPRLVFDGAFCHVLNRGLEKMVIFKTKGDYRYFLMSFKKAIKKYDWIVYSYCVLPNHYHFQVQMRKDHLGKILQSIQTAYAVYFNKKYDRVGPVFQGRFKSVLCQRGDYFTYLSKYIHLNPVKAGLVNKPGDYQWSSYKEYISQVKSNKRFVSRSAMKRVLGELSLKAINEYKRFIQDEDELEYKPVRGVLGSKKFRESIETSWV